MAQATWARVLLVIYFLIHAHELFSAKSHDLNPYFSDQWINETKHPNFHRSWDCERKWPKLELFLPFEAFHKGADSIDFYEVELFFVRTFRLFWPIKLSHTTVLLLYDKEKEDYASVQSLNQTVAGEKYFRLAGAPEFPYYNNKGYDRQQYYCFWADNFTDSPYIGFSDSDMAFLTYVDREDLFEHTKPVVNGRWGLAPNYQVELWYWGTNITLKTMSPFHCMTYFPVIIKREHLRLLREHISLLHNMPFDEVFQKIMTAQPYSQYDIMCTYIFQHHRDEYSFRIATTTPNWDGKDPSPGQDPDVIHLLTKEEQRPKPRISTHVKYRNKHQSIHAIPNGKHFGNFISLLQNGICRSPPFPRNESVCKNIHLDLLWDEMYTFETANYAIHYNASILDHEARLRHNRIKNCSHGWNEDAKFILEYNV